MSKQPARELARPPRWQLKVRWFVAAACLAFSGGALGKVEQRGHQFIGITEISSFKKSPGAQPREVVLTSPLFKSSVQFNELLLSWNAQLEGADYLQLEVRAVYPEYMTKYYSMGLWSADPARHPRQSVVDQEDSDGDVRTDILELKRPAEALQVRLVLGGENHLPEVKFLGICLTDTKAEFEPLPPKRAAWGKLVPVPERSQMAYPRGGVLCSPTTVSMMMSLWAERLKRSDLERDVPEVEKAVYDPNWHGTGNWSFNMAYAGSFPGMRAYVTRLSDVSELEDWIARGIPVGLSVCYNKLRGREGRPTSGHLVVCVGFTDSGDVIINDPGTTLNVRKTFPRKNVIAAWAHSRNAVYLIYPERAKIPKDRFGHWGH